AVADILAGFEISDDSHAALFADVEQPVELPGDPEFGQYHDPFHPVGIDDQVVVDEGLAVGVDVGSPLVGDVEVFAAVDPFGDAVDGGAEVGAGAGFGGLFRGFDDLVELVFVFGFAGDGEGVEVFPCGDAQYDVALRPLLEPEPVGEGVGYGGGPGPGSFFAGFR